MVGFFEKVKRKLFLMRVSPALRPTVKFVQKGGDLQDLAKRTNLIDFKALDNDKEWEKHDQFFKKLFKNKAQKKKFEGNLDKMFEGFKY